LDDEGVDVGTEAMVEVVEVVDVVEVAAAVVVVEVVVLFAGDEPDPADASLAP